MSLVETILDRAIALGTQKSSEASTAASAATTAAQGYAYLDAPVLGLPPAVVEPAVNIPANASGVDQALYSSTYEHIITDLGDRFAGFFNDYFPSGEALMPGVQAWLQRALTTGGTGVDATVEDQIWQRDRERVLRDSSSAQRDAVAGWAARGFPLPPGAAVANVQQIQRDASAKIREQSRERAIQTFAQELENVRFAITNAIDLRMRAVAAAGDYIRALALAPQIASQLSTTASNAQASLINAASSYYNARIRVSELKFQSQKLNADNTLQAGLRNLASFDGRLDVQARTALAIAQSLGQQAASALNAVNGTAQQIVNADS